VTYRGTDAVIETIEQVVPYGAADDGSNPASLHTMITKSSAILPV